MFFRQVRKDHNWVRSFYLIVMAGGEVPPLRVFHLDERFEQLEGSIPNDPDVVPVQSFSKIESVPFGVVENPEIMGTHYSIIGIPSSQGAFVGSNSQIISCNDSIYHCQGEGKENSQHSRDISFNGNESIGSCDSKDKLNLFFESIFELT